MTIHKSQGSEFDHVVVVLPPAASRLASRELLYTAVTRARRHVTIIGSDDAFARRHRALRGSGERPGRSAVAGLTQARTGERRVR